MAAALEGGDPGGLCDSAAHVFGRRLWAGAALVLQADLPQWDGDGGTAAFGGKRCAAGYRRVAVCLERPAAGDHRPAVDYRISAFLPVLVPIGGDLRLV